MSSSRPRNGVQQAAPTLATIRAWRWSGSFDLDVVPPSDGDAGLVMVRSSGRPLVAVQLIPRSAHWGAGEILVSEQASPQEVNDGELCLVRVQHPRARGMRTVIAVAHFAHPKRGRTLRFEPISPAGAALPADDGRVIAVFRAIYRGRHLT